ncbi:MAG: hypothetical protein LH479_01065, partial [Polaromonas sp.]|nr:hypothetical protein [Polaromonas sp.]
VIAGGSGATATAIVTLTAAAPSGGTVVTIGSSNTELAASVPQVTVAAGQRSVSFPIATNAQYRRYSGLAFSSAISAVNPVAGAAVSATLNVTTQAIPADLVISPRPDRSGNVCAGEPGILFNCPTGSAACRVRQECTFGCENRPLKGTNWDDICAAAGPVPITLSPKRLVGGHPGAGTLQLSSGAPAGSFGLVSSNSLVAAEPSRMNLPIATGATSKTFSLRTAAVNGIQFAPIDGRVTTPRAVSGGGTFFASRSARSWLAVVPGTLPPVTLLSLAVESPSLLGGQATSGTTCVDQLAPVPEVGSITVSLSSSHPAVAPLRPAQAVMTQGGDCVLFVVETSAVASNMAVTLSAQLGAQLLTPPMLVTATPVAAQVISFFLNPLSLTGGQSTQATLVLNGRAPAAGFQVNLFSVNPAVLPVPASVIVPAGTDRVSFNLVTAQVGADVLVTLQATPSSSVMVAQLSVLAPAGAPTLSAVAVNPATVAGGVGSTGTVTLSGAALAGGAVVSLASNTSMATVPATVTVAAGATSAQFAVSTLPVSTDTVATLPATLGGIGNVTVSRTAALSLTPSAAPAPGALAAPSLLSPANDARFPVGQAVNFDWSDVTGAVTYVIQLDDSDTFTAPLLLNQSAPASQYLASAIPASRPYWRVRAVDAAGNPGAWSATGKLRVE